MWLVAAGLGSMGLEVSAEFTENVFIIHPTRGLLVPESEQVLRKVLPSKQSKVFQAKEVQNVSCEEVKDVKVTVPNKRQTPGDTVKKLPSASSLQLMTSVFPSLLDHSHKYIKHVIISPV